MAEPPTPEDPEEPGGFGDDPELDQLLDRWTEVDHHETAEPDRDWSVLFGAVILVVVAGLGAAAFQLFTAGDRDRNTSDDPIEARDQAASVLEGDLPSLDELTSDVTLPLGPEGGLTVGERGITIVEDRFDPARREGTFAVILENPHTGWLAQGVQVDVTFLDPSGAPLGTDGAFLEIVLPGQRVAVASLFFDAPTVPVADIAVDLDVARWRETEPFTGALTTSEVVTSEAEFSGVRTTFVLTSTFDEPLTDVGVTAVYRAADGRIIGGYDTFVDLLEPGVATPAEITLLANIDPAEVVATELFPYAGFGFVPDED